MDVRDLIIDMTEHSMDSQVVVIRDGKRYEISGSNLEYGPEGYEAVLTLNFLNEVGEPKSFTDYMLKAVHFIQKKHIIARIAECSMELENWRVCWKDVK